MNLPPMLEDIGHTNSTSSVENPITYLGLDGSVSQQGGNAKGLCYINVLLRQGQSVSLCTGTLLQ